jgi:hypothetical protein
MVSERLSRLIELRTRGGFEAKILQQLDRVLKSARFRNNSQPYKESKWLVEESVLGQRSKASPYGTNPELGEMLREYAKDEGASDPMRILLREGLPVYLVGEPRLVISHRHKDEPIAKGLVSSLETAFEIQPTYVVCTSTRPHRIVVGEPISERLRNDLAAAEVVMGLVAPDTNQSSWVPFEMGAAWGRKRPTWPLLILGATVENLPGPMRELNALSLSDPSDCQDLMESLDRFTTLRRRAGVGGALYEKIQRLAVLAAAG